VFARLVVVVFHVLLSRLKSTRVPLLTTK
jgi:hypothetical protein